MLSASLRSSLTRTVPRTVSRQTRALRTMVTKDERWTPATNRAGQGLIDNKQALELDKVVPNIESMWTKMSKEEQYSVYKQLEQLQRKDWHELSLGEKKAGACFLPYRPAARKLTVAQRTSSPTARMARASLLCRRARTPRC